MRGAFLEDMTWPEAAARIAAGAVVDACRRARPRRRTARHLPLRTDYLVARELVDGLIAMCPDLAP